MSKYFTESELSHSDTAIRRGIDNTPGPEAASKLRELAGRLLDPVREKWGRPLRVNSGYRSPTLNRAVGGATRSQHLKGEAADITAGNRADNKRLFEMIRNGDFEFDQLIWEKGDDTGPEWIHLSYTSQPRHQILRIK